MEPAEALYFANPGPDGKFNKDYAFHWADFNNEPINDWKSFIQSVVHPDGAPADRLLHRGR
jgi:type I restriction enzyme R subunit